MIVRDVTGMPEYYEPVLNESGEEIKNGHLSEGMPVTIPDPLFGAVVGSVDIGSIFRNKATATSGSVRFWIELDPSRAIWVSSNICASALGFSGCS